MSCADLSVMTNEQLLILSVEKPELLPMIDAELDARSIG